MYTVQQVQLNEYCIKIIYYIIFYFPITYCHRPPQILELYGPMEGIQMKQRTSKLCFKGINPFYYLGIIYIMFCYDLKSVPNQSVLEVQTQTSPQKTSYLESDYKEIHLLADHGKKILTLGTLLRKFFLNYFAAHFGINFSRN